MTTVLLVDDDEGVRTFVKRALEIDGYAVQEAADGAEALDLLRGSAADTGLVLSDIVMPVMDGIEFIKNVRATGQHNSLPILILTTETSQDKRDQGKAAGGTGWIVKPFDPEKLISVINRVVH